MQTANRAECAGYLIWQYVTQTKEGKEKLDLKVQSILEHRNSAILLLRCYCAFIKYREPLLHGLEENPFLQICYTSSLVATNNVET
jgi:L-lysine 2,3-aminomutase